MPCHALVLVLLLHRLLYLVKNEGFLDLPPQEPQQATRCRNLILYNIPETV